MTSVRALLIIQEGESEYKHKYGFKQTQIQIQTNTNRNETYQEIETQSQQYLLIYGRLLSGAYSLSTQRIGIQT